MPEINYAHTIGGALFCSREYGGPHTSFTNNLKLCVEIHEDNPQCAEEEGASMEGDE